ncbi:MAG TPA: chemotaxis response regulator protein-glutamate methylesterase [Dehalococcoidia bacterium]|nr:chemotaxis response regulator protein-glutamate methylesterase [Dehalococcoidia bacterium]
MGKRVKVLVVDDSAVARSVLVTHLSQDPEIEIIGTATDGLEALSRIKQLRPDVVTLDVMMPRMDGLRALRRIMAEAPTPVVMVSVLSREGSQITVKALELGAVDFVLKRLGRGQTPMGGMMDDLRTKVKLAAGANLIRVPEPRRERGAHNGATPARVSWRDRVVVIGSSTGGPQALRTLLHGLPAGISIPFLVVQHMPAWFTGSLAQSLDTITPLRVVEAQQGMDIEAGTVYIAPGDYHMLAAKDGRIRLSRAARELGVRPSINVTLQSAADIYGASTLGVILTGMGTDGTRGARVVKDAGGQIISQDEATSVVYGMPRSVAEAGLSDKVAPLSAIAGEIVRLCRATAPRVARP